MAMIRVKIAELRDGLSRYLRAVERGDSVEVLRRDRPVARIVPVEREDEIMITPAARPFAEIRDKQCPPANLGYDIVELLLEDRRKR